MKHLSNIDLANNQLQNAVVHPLGTAPANPSDGQIYYNSTNGNKRIYVYDAQLAGWKSISGDIEALSSTTTGQLTISGASGPTPSFTIVTGAVTNGGTALATGDQIYDFVLAQTSGSMSSFTVAGDSGTTAITNGNTLTFDGVDGLVAAVTTDKVTISRNDTSRSNTSNTVSPANGGTFTVIDSMTSNQYGDVTGVNTKTVTLPSQTSGTVKSVGLTAGALIDITGATTITDTGSWEVNVDLSELTTTTVDADLDFFAIVDGTAQKKIAPSSIPFSKFGSAESTVLMGGHRIINLGTPTANADAATKLYVDNAVLGSGSLSYQGAYDAATNTPKLDATPIAGIKTGWTYTVTVDGLFFTEQVRVGDMLIAEIDNPTTLADWTTVQSNIDLATTSTAGIASFSSSNFSVSGTGVVSVKDNGIILGTETTGNYVSSVSTGAGLDGSSNSEGGTAAITLALNEIATSTTVATNDHVVVVENGNNRKTLVSDLAAVINGAGEFEYTITGNASTSVFTAVHSLGFDVFVEIYDNKSASPTYGQTVYVDTKRVATGTEFTFGNAPATGDLYKVIIRKIA